MAPTLFFICSTCSEVKLLRPIRLKSVNLLEYNTLVCWFAGTNEPSTQCLMFQALFFFMISFKICCKNGFNLFLYFFYEFTKITIKSFECPKVKPANHCFIFQSIKIILRPSDAWSIRQSTQQPCVLYWKLLYFWTSSSSENHSLICLKNGL